MENITDIGYIYQLEGGDDANFCARIESVFPIEEFRSHKLRRYVNLVGLNNSTVTLVLWDEDTSLIDENQEGKILTIYKAKVNIYKGNFEIKRCRGTQFWWRN